MITKKQKVVAGNTFSVTVEPSPYVAIKPVLVTNIAPLQGERYRFAIPVIYMP
ncbi:hypothetical protein [Enterobacter huaxiensis]|uniref:hypothetical protein n=1 Tax=Enterobacter huaxiensis TaxID=2494702 RepID=UPI00143DA0BB|nr:hypothetical protein [Enterobacter huaxiensis]